MRIIARTKNYPELLVQHGHVHFNEEDLSKTIGSVFLEKTQLNLQVLAPTALLQVMYSTRSYPAVAIMQSVSTLTACSPCDIMGALNIHEYTCVRETCFCPLVRFSS